MKKKTFLILYGIIYFVVYLLVWTHIYLNYGFTSESAAIFSVLMYCFGVIGVLSLEIFRLQHSEKRMENEFVKKS